MRSVLSPGVYVGPGAYIYESIILTDTTEHYPLLDRLPRSMCQALSKPVNTRKLYRAISHLLSDKSTPTLRSSPPMLMPKVLCVDDQPANLRLLEVFLQDMGVTALLAHSGEEALEVLEEIDHKIDLMISDVVMPEMDGPALLIKVRERLPDLKVIFVSGYAEESVRQDIADDQSVEFLAKPYSLDQINSKVKEVLGKTGRD